MPTTVFSDCPCCTSSSSSSSSKSSSSSSSATTGCCSYRGILYATLSSSCPQFNGLVIPMAFASSTPQLVWSGTVNVGTSGAQCQCSVICNSTGGWSMSVIYRWPSFVQSNSAQWDPTTPPYWGDCSPLDLVLGSSQGIRDVNSPPTACAGQTITAEVTQ